MRVAVRWGIKMPEERVLASLMIGVEMRLSVVLEGGHCYYFGQERQEFAGYDEALPIVTPLLGHFRRVSLFGTPEICINIGDDVGWLTRDEYIVRLEQALKNTSDGWEAAMRIVEQRVQRVDDLRQG